MSTPERNMHFTECPHGGYNERIDLTVEPWATLAPLCWNSPSSFRLGWEAEKHGVTTNPFRSRFAGSVFDAARQRCKAHGLSGTRALPASKKQGGV